jgi:formylglycine-generating enzyme required for sulfatase activity
VWSVGFSPDGKRIVSGSSDNTVKVWSFDTVQVTKTKTPNQPRIGAAVVAVEGMVSKPFTIKPDPTLIPEHLRGASTWDFPAKVTTSEKNAVLRFNVLQGGEVFLIAHWKYQGNTSGNWYKERLTKKKLIAQGWQDLGPCAWDQESFLFKKTVEQGEMYVIRTNKYWPPQLVTRSASPPLDRPAASLPARLRQGLVAYYPFNGNANDESGNGNDGEVTGATLSADRHRKDDRSYVFDGIDDRIVVTDHQLDIFGRAQASTISIWVNIDPQSGGTILTKGFIGSANAGGNQYLHIGVGKYGVPWYTLYKNDLETGTWLYGVKESCVLGNWFHLVCVRDSESAIYVNGEDQTDHKHVRHHNHWMVDYDAAFGGTPLSFGAVPSVGRVRYGKFFDGQLDDIRIYNRALSAEEVNALYEHERADPGQARTLRPSPAIAPFDAKKARQHQQSWADHLGVPIESTNSLGMKFMVIPPGEFMMGSNIDARIRPPHKVTLTKPFELGMYEVTQEQYAAVVGTNRSKFQGSQNPAEMISWNDAVAFCRLLSEIPREKEAGYEYRLPTEAEWEYACRAGTTTDYYFGDGGSELVEHAWFDKNSGRTTDPVGGKKPNALGLYDMHGNVFEWCQDWYGKYPSGASIDPKGASFGQLGRVLRGGGFQHIAFDTLIRGRDKPVSRASHHGFRVLRSSIK